MNESLSSMMSVLSLKSEEEPGKMADEGKLLPPAVAVAAAAEPSSFGASSSPPIVHRKVHELRMKAKRKMDSPHKSRAGNQDGTDKRRKEHIDADRCDSGEGHSSGHDSP